jgi:hypothetical protein
MERLTETDVIAINKLLEYAWIARSNGRRCDVEMHFKSDERVIALKVDLGEPHACYAVAYEPTIPTAVARVLTQAADAEERERPTDPRPPAFEPLPADDCIGA